MRKAFALLAATMLTVFVTACSARPSAATANSNKWSTSQYRKHENNVIDSYSELSADFANDHTNSGSTFYTELGPQTRKIKSELKRIKASKGHPTVKRHLINLSEESLESIEGLRINNMGVFGKHAHIMATNALWLRKHIGKIDTSLVDKSTDAWNNLKKSQSAESASESRYQASLNSISIGSTDDAPASSLSHDDSSTTQVNQDSSSSSSVSNAGITNSDIESAIEEHNSGLKVRDVEGQFDKPYTAGIEMTVKDTPKYNTEAGFKEDAYHILLAVKDEIGLNDFQNISITFYMHGDAMVKSEFNQSALSKINSSDSNYFNIQNTATTWDASNFHSELNR